MIKYNWLLSFLMSEWNNFMYEWEWDFQFNVQTNMTLSWWQYEYPYRHHSSSFHFYLTFYCSNFPTNIDKSVANCHRCVIVHNLFNRPISKVSLMQNNERNSPEWWIAERRFKTTIKISRHYTHIGNRKKNLKRKIRRNKYIVKNGLSYLIQTHL